MESNTTKTLKSGGGVFDFATLTEDAVIYGGRDQNGTVVLKKN
jgi:hypothetical protein